MTTTLLDRRAALRRLTLAAATLVLPRGGRAQSCVQTPAQMLGPYYLDTGLVRQDIREGTPGTALRVAITVVDASRCTAIPNALVEVWHADASGRYSGFAGEGTLGETFCRGGLETGEAGSVEFLTVYPGWYPGRAVHVHFRITVGGAVALVSQLYFPEGVTDAVYAHAPYASRGAPDTRNDEDGIFNGVGDASAVITDVTQEQGTYVARLTVGVLSSVTTTTTTGSSTTTTTTLPSACETTIALATSRCRATELRTAVTNLLSDGPLRERLLAILDRRVFASFDLAAAAARDDRRRAMRARLQRALVALRLFRKVLASRLGRQGADAAVRSALDTAAIQVGTSIAALRAV